MKNDGGPAFPRQLPTVLLPPDMSPRDVFAAVALCGSLACDNTSPPAKEASWAYDYADAMLAERDK